MTDSPAIANLLQRLESHPLPTIELKLDRVLHFLNLIGNPHEKLPPVIHVAGTNGKGSTMAYLRALLEGRGDRVHVYSSPHLVRFNERIVIAGQEIDDDSLAKHLRFVLEQSKDCPLTYFEATTIAAFLAFAETPADWLLLEVGMGGRLDATNVIAQPALTIITSISKDHEAFLGDTLAEIAGEKAGIIKNGVPCVTGFQAEEAMEVIAAKAAELNAPVLEVTEPYTGDLPLAGEHQRQNAALALAAYEKLTGASDATALQKAEWPARLQKLTAGPLVRDSYTVWLDGGHNSAAGDALAGWCKETGARPALVLGMMRGKDVAGYLQQLRAHLSAITTVTIEDEDAYSAQELADLAGGDALAADTVEEAVLVAAKHSDQIIIGGSLYLAGQILEKNH